MRVCIPDQAWRDVCEAVEKKRVPQDPFLKRVYNVINRKESNQSIEEALDLIENMSHRISVIAFFLSGADIDQISISLSIRPDTLAVFRKLCIDMDVFRNKLEWNDYAIYFAEHYCADNERLRREVQSGVSIGPMALQKYWLRGNEELGISSKELTRKILEVALEKAMIATGSSINSRDSKEALRWGQFAVKVAPVHNNMRDTQEVDEGAWAVIEQRRAAKRPQETEVEKLENILH